MKTHHIVILSLAFIIGLSGTMQAQNHSIIVDMKETGKTTPRPRSTTPGFSLSSARQEISVKSKEVLFVAVDLAKKEICVRYNSKETFCEMEIVNADRTFRYKAQVKPGGVTNVFYLREMIEPGIYYITIRVPDKSFTGYFIY